MNFENLINHNAYSLSGKKKNEFFKNYLNTLTSHHYKKSDLYKKYLNGIRYNHKFNKNLKELPFLPVRLFKEFDLISINKKNVFKTLYSSGTTSNNLSKIYLDKKNALNQIKVLQKIFNNLIGNLRIPMLIIDKKKIELDRKNFNASTAAINGFSIFANETFYLLNEKNNIDYKNLNKFLKKHNKKKFLIFGFTANVFTNLIENIDNNRIDKNAFTNAILVHGGGWKKIEEKKIDRNKFNDLIDKKLGIKNIRNYYGLVEQIGSIFFDCKCGYFIASNFSEVIIRDDQLNICKTGQKGFIQLLSLLPSSYPGHSILTEDIGEIVKDDNCKCYGPGTRFLVHGRLQSAELRGCSNI